MSNKEWIASVQYNDLTGTAAADGYESAISELGEYLNSKGVDTSDLYPIGLKIWNGEMRFSFSILCRNQSGKIISFDFEKKQDLNELRKILKRLEVVLLARDLSPENYDWSSIEYRTVDDRPE